MSQDKILSNLKTLRLALQNPDTWSLKPLVKLCDETILLRQAETAPKPYIPPHHTEDIVKKESTQWS